MDERIVEFFARENIEYYAALDYKDAMEINPRLRERKGIEARSVIVFLLPYYSGETVNLSRYAASLDYHIAISGVTSRLSTLLGEIYPQSLSLGFGDHSPIDERGAALSLGLGILGENGLLINEKYGSYVFIADVVTDVPPEILGVSRPLPVLKCEGCGLCKKACPTGVLSGESSECLSAITQKKGELSEKEMEMMLKFNTVWGCDECQSACPHNKNPRFTPLDFFSNDRISHLTLDTVNSMDDNEFSKRAFAWRGRKTVIRNLEYCEKANKCKH